MLTKYFRPIIILTLVVVLLQVAVPALALEVTYPNIPGAPANGPQTGGEGVTLVSYISYFFLFIVGAAGIIAVLTIVFSGLQILMAAGNSGAISTARERIWYCIAGIVLLFFSFILLKTINPELLSQSNPSGGFPAGNGLYFISYGEVSSERPTGIYWEAAPDSVDDTTGYILDGWTELYYKCDTPDRKILLWAYNDAGQEIDPVANSDRNATNMATRIISCGDTVSLIDDNYPIGSFSWDFEEPGIYLYIDDNCKGISSYVQQMNLSFVGVPYFGQPDYENNEISSVRIVSGNSVGWGGDLTPQRYGFIAKNYDGECSAPQLQINPGSNCIKMTDILSTSTGDFFRPWSFYTMLLNPDPIPTPSGNAVKLRSENLEVTLTDRQIGTHWPWTNDPNTLFIGANNYQGTVTPEGECQDPDNDCLKDIEIQEPQRRFYNTVLYSKNEDTGDFACKVFRNNVGTTNWGSESFADLLTNNKKLYRIDIIPSDAH